MAFADLGASRFVERSVDYVDVVGGFAGTLWATSASAQDAADTVPRAGTPEPHMLKPLPEYGTCYARATKA
jgi:hypothetical protein